jgi:hypothetical protein
VHHVAVGAVVAVAVVEQVVVVLVERVARRVLL